VHLHHHIIVTLSTGQIWRLKSAVRSREWCHRARLSGPSWFPDRTANSSDFDRINAWELYCYRL